MDKQPAVSVIVPVYKAENYLCHCVDSLLAQTFPDFEILLIDDGSPDHSGDICDEYARKDSRVRVFHKENEGVSSTRQCGIDNAKGEYTIHADPDDWVEPDMLEELYKKAKEEDADVVICDFMRILVINGNILDNSLRLWIIKPCCGNCSNNCMVAVVTSSLSELVTMVMYVSCRILRFARIYVSTP